MSDFSDKIKDAAHAVSAAIDNELTVLEGAGGDDPLAHHDDDPAATADDTSADDTSAADASAGNTAAADPA